MKLTSLKLTNFKCFRELEFSLSQLSIFVGENNCGKSAIFASLDKFFTSTGKLTTITADDFHINDLGEVSDKLCIELSFGKLSSKAIEDFKEYTKLPEIVFKLTCERKGEQITSKFTGVRHGFQGFSNAFELSKSAPASEFNTEYKNLCNKFVDLPHPSDVTNKQSKLDALRSYESLHPEQCVSIESNDEAYGSVGPVSKIIKYLKWVYIPAVKDAADEASEGKNAFTDLINFAARRKTNFDDKISDIEDTVSSQLDKLKEEQQEALTEINQQLNISFNKISIGTEKVELNWDKGTNDLKVTPPRALASIISGNHKGPVNLFGHGLQRNYLVSLLKVIHELEHDDENQITLLLGFEEPELYQHPPQARLLARYLKAMSQVDQILITTHSPTFIAPELLGAVHRVESKKGESSIVTVSLESFTTQMSELFKLKTENVNSTIASLLTLMDLNIREIFFSRLVVVVEGLEDIGYIEAAVDILSVRDQWIECGVNIIPALGKNAIIPIVELCKAYEIPFFVIFDADSSHRNKTADGTAEETKKTNRLLLKQLGQVSKEPFFDEVQMGANYIIWPENIQKSVLSDCPEFEECLVRASEIYGPGKRKNPKLVNTAIRNLHLEGHTPSCLEDLVSSVISFAK